MNGAPWPRTSRLLPVLAAAAVQAAGLGAARAEPYAPLDCAKATSPSEIAICTSYALGQDEARMATLFGIATALVAMGERGAIGDEQRQWLRTRDACGVDAACLADAYHTRIAALSAVIAAIAARGPF
jgi:uncharacterized protein